MMIRFSSFLLIFVVLCCACESTKDNDLELPPPEEEQGDTIIDFYRGADLSYVNEMLDCGAVYLDERGENKDPYLIFQAYSTNLIRVRLWHNPGWTAYSNFEDVAKTIARAKALNMQVLLDFHYSDDWADPQKQDVPAAWLDVVDDTPVLGDSLYNYTFSVLDRLNQADLLPEFVQIGNEINIEILQAPESSSGQINWDRNAFLINRGLEAVRDAANTFEKDIEIFLHIAQPENALWWFEEARQQGVINYDWIGISYYPKWSEYTISELPSVIRTLKDTHNKRFMVVETAYPYTMNNQDQANNILGPDAGIEGFDFTAEGQYNYLKTLEQKIVEGGGEGMIYWEPAWVSTSCSTRWGQGSHWDNATLFDQTGRINPGMNFFKGN